MSRDRWAGGSLTCTFKDSVGIDGGARLHSDKSITQHERERGILYDDFIYFSMLKYTALCCAKCAPFLGYLTQLLGYYTHPWVKNNTAFFISGLFHFCRFSTTYSTYKHKNASHSPAANALARHVYSFYHVNKAPLNRKL